MKKLLMGSFTLTVLAISISLIQTGCSKEAIAQNNSSSYTLPAATSTSLGGVIVGSGLSVNSSGVLSIASGNSNSQLNKLIYMKYPTASVPEIWISNYDGTGQAKINVILPAGVVFSDNLSARMSPNGQKLFFEAGTPYQTGALTSVSNDIYSCNIDGSSVTKVISRGTDRSLTLNGAY
jgi:hypothetical protein